MTTLKKIGEFGLIQRIAKKFKNSRYVTIGIGDDAALVRNGSKASLLTTDMLVEGVDFDFKSATPEQVGRKSLAVNLSDIAAMGGVPQFALIGLGIPKATKLSEIEKFAVGISRIASQYGVDVVGGDLSSAPCWMITVSLIGSPGNKTVSRSDAKVGDRIYVTGELGGSIAGKHLTFLPRAEEGEWLADFGATSMIDISDGFLQDLGHILERSRVGARIHLDQIPISRHAKKISKNNRKKALGHALTDGEDFELLFTVRKSKSQSLEGAWKKRFGLRLTCVGEIQKNEKKIHFYCQGKKVSFRIKKKGYQHFS